jgi:hypothetical protein
MDVEVLEDKNPMRCYDATMLTIVVLVGVNEIIVYDIEI